MEPESAGTDFRSAVQNRDEPMRQFLSGRGGRLDTPGELAHGRRELPRLSRQSVLADVPRWCARGTRTDMQWLEQLDADLGAADCQYTRRTGGPWRRTV